jgi:putative DNA primase/helicase
MLSDEPLRLDLDDPEHETDLGNARRLVAWHGSTLRYLAARNTWLIWTGQYWAEDETGEVMRRAKDTVARLYVEAGYELDPGRRAALAKHALASESVRALTATVTLAATEPGIPVTLGDLDRDPFLLNVGNGTLDLKTATLRPHDPADLITKLIPTAYDPTAAAPTWMAFLERILKKERPALLAFVQRMAGYALTGDVSEQVIFVLFGTGSNGKSTLLLTLAHVLNAYAATLNVETC